LREIFPRRYHHRTVREAQGRRLQKREQDAGKEATRNAAKSAPFSRCRVAFAATHISMPRRCRQHTRRRSCCPQATMHPIGGAGGLRNLRRLCRAVFSAVARWRRKKEKTLTMLMRHGDAA